MFGQIKYWVREKLSLKKVWSQRFDMDEVVGPSFFLVQTILGSKKIWIGQNVGRKNVPHFCLSPEMFFGPQKFLLKKN